ncbi:hypothetical protein NLU13_6151 [Sarocladium strictum]|uniref:Uncharacterized protein n=1 Tax=Sarocladium strictum TaxID=5046 RepID=A0AA39L750_SARSR|nr:hypothetical protein NLU13_6151 [Sarocladium strictum]
MSDEGPPLLRPTPRRPFEINFSGLTTPSDEGGDSPTSPRTDSNLLTANDMASATSSSLSRPPSIMNLTSSTLFGIYSPTDGPSGRRERDDLMDTPWGTGSQTPVRRPTLDEATYELMKERSHLQRRRSSYRSVDSMPLPQQSSPLASAASLTLRGALLFLLGVGYGAVVSRFHHSPEGDDSMYDHAYFLAFWGVAGVVLGALLPWFDKFWEEKYGGEDEDEAVPGTVDVVSGVDETNAGTDWALVMRAIGAFVGIVFAIRKLPWSSTLQVSITLALVNPLLWWLIDRSKSGFLLSAAVGLAGSMVLLGVNPAMMPTPSVTSEFFRTNASSATGEDDDELMMMLGGLLARNNEMVESGVWMLSVLFCSCVCFGNIGRRLAWGSPAVAKGRWGGVR